MRPRTFVVSLALLLLCSVQGSTQKLPSNVAEAQIFVRKFYKWYTPIAQKSKQRTASVALNERRSSFAPKLVASLEADFAAQQNSNEIVGIDWDPFLSGQDTCDKYPDSTPVAMPNTIRVPIFCQQGNTLSSKPVVIAEVSYVQGRWVFTNFIYEKNNLLEILAGLKKSREDNKSTT